MNYSSYISYRRYQPYDSNFMNERISPYEVADKCARDFFRSPQAHAGLFLVLSNEQYSIPYAVPSYSRFQELLEAHRFANPSGIAIGDCGTYSPQYGFKLPLPASEARKAIAKYKKKNGGAWIKEATAVVQSGDAWSEWKGYANLKDQQ